MHIFLTGPKQVGKSTLLNQILHAYSGSLGGFRTLRLCSYLPGIPTVHLFAADEDRIPTEENLLFYCGKKRGDEILRFEILGCDALDRSVGKGLIIMDELGPHEAGAAKFRSAVMQTLERETPVLGVLQQSETPFLQEVAGHPRVKLITVTSENRNTLADRIPEILGILFPKSEGPAAR